MFQTNGHDPFDPNFKSIQYNRYADDFLVDQGEKGFVLNAFAQQVDENMVVKAIEAALNVPLYNKELRGMGRLDESEQALQTMKSCRKIMFQTNGHDPFDPNFKCDELV